MKINRNILICILTVLIVMFNINIVYADEVGYRYNEKHTWAWHDFSDITKEINKNSGYKDTIYLSKENIENDTISLQWDMSSKVTKIPRGEGTNGEPTYKWTMEINNVQVAKEDRGFYSDYVDSSIRTQFKNHKFDYKGRIVVGENKINWTIYVDIKILEWNEDGSKFKYSIGIYEKDKNEDNGNYDQSISGEKFSELRSKKIEEYRYVKPGANYYEYSVNPNGGLNTYRMTMVDYLTGNEQVYVLKKDEDGGWSKIKYEGKIYYMQNEDLRESKAPEEEITKIEEVKEQEESVIGGSLIENFEPNSGGVIIGDLQGSPIADPTNAMDVNTYNPYTSDSTLTEANSTKILELGKTVIGILNVIATVVAILVLTALGIKYMMGSIEEKAEYKETMMPYIIGAIFVFSSTSIVNFIYNFAITFNK